MNIQQLEYAMALSKFLHFGKAASHCNVTQPTLSMMLQKLEDELGFMIFERGVSPLGLTPLGLQFLEETVPVLSHLENIKALKNNSLISEQGELKMGIIPTVAPGLLPLFLKSFAEKNPNIRLNITEDLSHSLVSKLKSGELDIAIMSPLESTTIFKKIDLYKEHFVVFGNINAHKKYVLPEDLRVENILLLEEGHCFRDQIIDLCASQKSTAKQISYGSGSLETLKNLASRNLGITVLPYLSTLSFSESDLQKTKAFIWPQPSRTISIISSDHFYKYQMLELLRAEILANLPEEIEPFE
jgi:LysR family transcriptional regulator, hydrogen peroxide-inducible genes activator